MLTILLLGSVSLSAQNWVKFAGTTETGSTLQLTGILTVPQVNGPFPAVVMLHGCSALQYEGVAQQLKMWAERLVSWGYVTLQVDSFGPRSIDNTCADFDSPAVSPLGRAKDAFSGKTYLAGLRIVDSSRIGIIGWSSGGTTALSVVEALNRTSDVKPFQAAVAFSPWCESFLRRDTPLLILIGAKDDWCPSRRCET